MAMRWGALPACLLCLNPQTQERHKTLPNCSTQGKTRHEVVNVSDAFTLSSPKLRNGNWAVKRPKSLTSCPQILLHAFKRFRKGLPAPTDPASDQRDGVALKRRQTSTSATKAPREAS